MPENISDELADQYINHAVNLQRFTEDVQQRTLGYLEQLERDLVEQLREADPTQPALSRFRQQRLDKLLETTRATIKTAHGDMALVSTKEIRPLVEIEGDFVVKTLNDAVGVDIASVKWTPEVINSIMSDTLIEGAPSREWWSRQSANLTRSFEDQMRQGVLQGEPLSTLVQRVRGKATGKRNVYWIGDPPKRKVFVEFKGGIMDTGTRQAEALVRTSVQSISNEARLQTFQQNNDVINGVQALATLDGRTSTVCIARSGAVWDLETGEPIQGTTETFPGPPPWHWNCRTTLIPYLHSWEELAGKDLGARKNKKIGEIPKSTQASMDGQVAEDLSYEQWLKKKPVEFQKEKLGPAKYELWKKDKLTFQDLISQTGRPLTVEQLKEVS